MKWFKVFGYFVTGGWLVIIMMAGFPKLMDVFEQWQLQGYDVRLLWGFLPMLVFGFGIAIAELYIIWAGILAYRILRESPSPDSALDDTDNDGVHPPQSPKPHSEEHHPLNDHKAP